MFGTPGCCGITRRGFLLGASAGLAVGAPLGWFAFRGWQAAPTFTGRTVEEPRAPLGRSEERRVGKECRL